MTEHKRARLWRIRNDLSVDQLAELTGYHRATIYLMERGVTAATSTRDHDTIDPQVWQRYKLVCAGVEAQLRSGKKFNW